MAEEKKGKTYLWLEDRQGKAGYTFWKILMQQISPDVILFSNLIS